MFSAVRYTSMMIVVIVTRTIVTVARIILTMMDRRILVIAPMCTGLLDWMSMGCVGIFMIRVTVRCVVCLGEYESGGSGIDENVIAFRLTGSDQPVNCVIGAAYPGIPYEEDGPPRTKSGGLINSVIQTSRPSGPGVPGDKVGTPWIGFAEPVSSFVSTIRPDGPGVPGNGNPKTRSEDPIYSVVCASRPDGLGGPCNEDSSTWAEPDTPYHCIVRMIPQGPVGPFVRDGDVSEGTFIPRDVLALSVGFRELATETLDKICLSPVNPQSELSTWDELSNRLLCDVGVIAVALCHPGVMCKLDCPWLSPSVDGLLVLTDLHTDCWELGRGDLSTE